MSTRPFGVLALLTSALAGLTFTATAWSLGPPRTAEKEPIRTDRYGDPLPKGAVRRLGTVRFSHPYTMSIAFSPDGRFLASGGYDNRIRLWDPSTGKEVRILEGHKSFINCIALSADGKWLASGSQDNGLRLWDTRTGKEKRRFLGHDRPIERLALSPDGKVLASSCHAGTLRLWDTRTGKQIRSLPIDPGYRVLAMRFSPDSKHFAFNNHFDKGIQLVDVADGKLVRTFPGHKDNVTGLTFSSDGKTLISGSSDHTIRAWDVATGKERRRYGDGKNDVTCLALAPDEKTLTYGTHPDGLVHIWDIASNKHLVPPWKAHRWCVVSIAYSPDSKKVAVARDTIAIHQTATGKRLNPTPENMSPIDQIEHASNGKWLAVRRRDGSIEVWDTSKWRKSATLEATIGEFTSMAFSPDGKDLTTAEGIGNKGIICHHDPKTGKRQKEVSQGEGWIEGLSYSADGKELAFTHLSPKQEIIIQDSATGKERARIPNPGHSTRKPRLSPEGRFLAGPGRLRRRQTGKGAFGLWDTKTGELVRRFGGVSHPTPELLVFSPDSRSIATSGSRGVAQRRESWQDVVLWETASGEERLRISMEDGALSQIAISPDGRLLAAAGQGETIRLWDAWTGKAAGRFSGHRGWMNALSFAPDGRTLASGGIDGAILIWDLTGVFPAKKPPRKLDRRERARCWDDLAGADSARAYQAVARLALRPGQAEGLLEDRLRRRPGIRERLARLLDDLDADEYTTREKASKELAALGRLAEGALKETLAGQPSAEVRRRVEDLLRKLDGKGEDPERLRLFRAIEVLERLGTPQARRLLAKLEKEAEPTLVREAKAALKRLEKSPDAH
jgi:WD40 repeat protein